MDEATTQPSGPMSLTEDPSTPNVRIMEDRFTCPRSETVRALAEMLDRERVVLVRGTPSSGKSTLARLLDDYYRRRNTQSVLIQAWPNNGGYGEHTDVLIQHARVRGYTEITNTNIGKCDIVFIIDEAQMSYHDKSLWLGFIQSQNGRRDGPRICLFCFYGSPAGGPIEGSSVGFIGPQKRVSLTVSKVPFSPSISLFYNRAEFDDILHRLCADFRRPISLDSAASDYIFELTSGHPGAVDAIIDILETVYRSEINHEGILTVGVGHVSSLLVDERAFFDLLRLNGFMRSFPRRKIDTTAASVLRTALVNQNVPLNLDDRGTEICYKNGWLHAEPVDIDAKTIVCVFPTVLHLKYTEHYFTGSSVPFPFDRFATVEALAEAVLRGFSRRNFSAARLGTGCTVRPVEACYQDEFYRSLQQVLGFSAKVTSKWSGDKDNRIDIIVEEPRWGVEIVREGDRLSEHCNRFVGNGKYTPWIRNGSLQDWLIIDCRTSYPREYKAPGTKLWRAVFAPDHTSLRILDANNQLVSGEFFLMP